MVGDDEPPPLQQRLRRGAGLIHPISRFFGGRRESKEREEIGSGAEETAATP